MGLGASSNKSNNKTTTNQTQTVTPTNPEWVTGGLAGLGGTLTNLTSADPYSFTSGPSTTQLDANEDASHLGQGVAGANPFFQQGTSGAYDNTINVGNAVAPSMTAAMAKDYLKDYFDPYTDAIVNSTLANFDKTAGQQTAQAKLDLAGDTTFGGSYGGIGLGNLVSQLGVDRAGVEGNLRSQAFNTALGAAQQDAGRAQQASQVNAGLADANLTRKLAAAGQQGALAQQLFNGALSTDANTRSNIDSKEATGEALRQIDLQRRLAPLSLTSNLAGIWGSLPLGLLHGQTSNLQGTTKGSGTSFGLTGSFGSSGGK